MQPFCECIGFVQALKYPLPPCRCRATLMCPTNAVSHLTLTMNCKTCLHTPADCGSFTCAVRWPEAPSREGVWCILTQVVRCIHKLAYCTRDQVQVSGAGQQNTPWCLSSPLTVWLIHGAGVLGARLTASSALVHSHGW
jgi:hypothetical protein